MIYIIFADAKLILFAENTKLFSKKIADMTKLSVNINKVATIRNARGGNNPDVL